MIQSSSLISLLTIVLYLASLFGLTGGVPSQGVSGTPGFSDSGYTGSNSGEFSLSTGGAVDAGDLIRVSGEVVNIRSGPGTNYPILGKVSKDETATVESGDKGWLKLRFRENLAGWVADYLVKPALGSGRAVSPHVPAGTQTIGYYATAFKGDQASLNSMSRAGKRLTGIAPFLFTVDSQGNISGNNDAAAVKKAKDNGQLALALVHNVSGDWFNEGVAHNLLSKQVNRTRAINEILYILKKYGYDGVNIDFESVNPKDREYLNTFMRELSWALRPKGYLVTISIPAKTWDDRSHKWSGAYDYKAIGEYADWVMIMAYDEHFKTGAPGPVASIGWVEKVIKFTTSAIPNEKVILGVPSYGYDWPTNGKSGRSVSYNQAMQIAKNNGLTPKWNSTHKVPYFSYVSNGIVREVWFESSFSLEHKLQLVRKYGLKGVALWRLGLEDPRTWDVIGEKLY